ncbi:MAG: XrtA-associated tyrosine autokinase [Burkholderiaceae bacterium]
MSLIERAINRLGRKGPAADPASAARSGISVAAAPSKATSESESRQQHIPPTLVAVTDNGPELPVLQIDPGILTARGHTAHETASRLGHEFRIIKRPLLSNAFGANSKNVTNGRRIMVTSALPGEGKSFCAINLALSIAAERDTSVLLVDADVAKPSFPVELGIPAGRGLMDWLVDPTIDIAQLVSNTSIPGLSVMTAGMHHTLATEYLASTAMTRLLDMLSQRYPDRILIFDSPPLLLTTEARVLAQHMGQIVLVVEAGRTSRQAVDDALSTIQSCEVINLLLNKAHGFGKTPGYGQYGYGYGYGAPT